MGVDLEGVEIHRGQLIAQEAKAVMRVAALGRVSSFNSCFSKKGVREWERTKKLSPYLQ